MTTSLNLSHLGMSGLRLVHRGQALAIDPPASAPEPAILTWSEAERVSGKDRRRIAALPGVLAWLGGGGIPLDLEKTVIVAEIEVATLAYRPIPYATPPEALRKTLIGLRRPRFTAQRLAHTLRRPKDQPVALRLHWGPWRIALMQQALHRFVDEAELARLQAFTAGCDLAVASPDYEDEAACGRLLGELGTPLRVLTDSIGPVRRMLGLPTRALESSLESAPSGTLLLQEGGSLRLSWPGRS